MIFSQVILYVQYFFVTIPPVARPTLLRQIHMGSLTCVHSCGLLPYGGHKGGSGTNKSAQELARRDRKTVLTLLHHEPAWPDGKELGW